MSEPSSCGSKDKVHHSPLESVGGCSSPSPRPWARRWSTTNVCDTWPVRRQTYGYLPSHEASLPIGWHQMILLGDRGTCMLTTCTGLHSVAGRPGFEPATYWSQVERPDYSATLFFFGRCLTGEPSLSWKSMPVKQKSKEYSTIFCQINSDAGWLSKRSSK